MDAILDLYGASVTWDWCESLRQEFGYSGGGGLFSFSLTSWLMIRQRLEGSSVEGAWLTTSPELARRFSPKSKRALSGNLSLSRAVTVTLAALFRWRLWRRSRTAVRGVVVPVSGLGSVGVRSGRNLIESGRERCASPSVSSLP